MFKKIGDCGPVVVVEPVDISDEDTKKHLVEAVKITEMATKNVKEEDKK